MKVSSQQVVSISFGSLRKNYFLSKHIWKCLQTLFVSISLHADYFSCSVNPTNELLSCLPIFKPLPLRILKDKILVLLLKAEIFRKLLNVFCRMRLCVWFFFVFVTPNSPPWLSSFLIATLKTQVCFNLLKSTILKCFHKHVHFLVSALRLVGRLSQDKDWERNRGWGRYNNYRVGIRALQFNQPSSK